MDRLLGEEWNWYTSQAGYPAGLNVKIAPELKGEVLIPEFFGSERHGDDLSVGDSEFFFEEKYQEMDLDGMLHHNESFSVDLNEPLMEEFIPSFQKPEPEHMKKTKSRVKIQNSPKVPQVPKREEIPKREVQSLAKPGLKNLTVLPYKDAVKSYYSTKTKHNLDCEVAVSYLDYVFGSMLKRKLKKLTLEEKDSFNQIADNIHTWYLKPGPRNKLRSLWEEVRALENGQGHAFTIFSHPEAGNLSVCVSLDELRECLIYYFNKKVMKAATR